MTPSVMFFFLVIALIFCTIIKNGEYSMSPQAYTHLGAIVRKQINKQNNIASIKSGAELM